MSWLKCFTTHEPAPVTFDYEGKVVHGTLDFAFEGQYGRIGNVVHYTFKVEVTTTGAGATELGISLPLVSDFSAEGKAAGSASTNASLSGGISGDTSNDRLALKFTAPSGSSFTFFCTVTYKVVAP
jgi:hypothetical protein